jgi:hypothetical protein
VEASGIQSTAESALVLEWLLEGDPAIRWQTLRDLQAAPPSTVALARGLVAEDGWGARLLAHQDPGGTWAGKMYSPKWTSTTYTMLLLRRMGLPRAHPQAQRACTLLLDGGLYHDGGINYFATLTHSETCVTGMVLSILAYFRYPDERLQVLARHLLEQQMADGGWNCESYRGARHSSFHTTISALEGLREYELFGAADAGPVRGAQERGREFLLAHRLYRSHRTGEVVNPVMTRFSFPPRWHYDVLRALDHFQACGAARDERLEDAIGLVRKRRKPDGRWLLQNPYKGRQFFEMERVRAPSRWNTLRALRVLKWWDRGL